MSDQTWKIPASPAQRLALMNLVHDKDFTVQGQEGRRLRRLLRSLSVMVIRDEMAEAGRVNPRLGNDNDEALFTFTVENRDMLRKLEHEIKRHPSTELVLGDLFDVVDELKEGQACAAGEGVPDYDPDQEDWKADGPRLDALDELNEAIERLTVEQIIGLVEHARQLAPPKEANPSI